MSTGPLGELWPDITSELLLPPDQCLPLGGHFTDTADLVARAELDRGHPWPQPLAHAAARFVLDGDREEYQEAVFERQWRLSRAVVAALVTEETHWLDEVADGVVLLCEQSSWCWPAHDDSWPAHGSVLPVMSSPYLDLGAGEVAGQLAWVDAALGPALDERFPGLRARMRHEVRVRVVEPFLNRRDWHWLGLDGDVGNWTPWIHGNILLVALRLIDDPELRCHVLDLAVRGLDRFVAVLPADGAVDEGYAYWWNGACRALEALDQLCQATRGVLDATSVPALRATVAFPHRMHLGGDWYLNLADGPARPPADQPWATLFRAARVMGEESAARHAAARRGAAPSEREGLGRLLLALTDREWADAAVTSPPLPRQVWLESIQVLLARPTEGTDRGLTLAVKGGHNGEHHNHNDVGQVVVAANGVPVVVDAGRPTYTARTFGPDRYLIPTMQSDWHSVPRIRGTAQRAGREFAARGVRHRLTDEIDRLELDLAAAYPGFETDHWWRSAQFDRRSGVITVTDAWSLTPGTGSSQVRYLLAGDVHLTPGRATVVHGDASVTLSWESGEPARLDVLPLNDPMLADVWGERLTRLSLDVGAAPTGSLNVVVELL
ncbi:heparinase II/III domain-containing protein [Kineosporia succinea]|uniref:Heparinase II/III-like C-terminal domain-containing protein n=1 Tax=Kineosporia succinea TaxID=84632 RepID=A0ABT9P820_9ACTN|nr:heparinase II/III family protein [Kineosporia succinea]MDP9828850.1 hypothetical protein [Kineosporia succinea]